MDFAQRQSWEHRISEQRAARQVDRPALYIGYTTYDAVIGGIVGGLVLSPTVYIPANRIRVTVSGPLEFEVRADGRGLTSTFLHRAHIDDCLDHLIWRMSCLYGPGFGHPGGLEVRSYLSLLRCLLGWDDHLQIRYSTETATIVQDYKQGRPCQPAVWQPRADHDPAFLFHARMEAGHFAEECLQKERLITALSPSKLQGMHQSTASKTVTLPPIELLFP